MGYTGDKKRQYQREWLLTRRNEWILEQGGRCTICSSSSDLEIDHINALEKNIPVAQLWSLSKTNPKRISELAKCRILCRKCHIDKTRNNTEKPRGSKNGASKLTEKQVQEGIELYKTGRYTYRRLGELFGVGETAFCYIIKRGGWKHVER